ncbi:MAG: hypothetical protein KJ938_01100 [Actinobacteria bacterium]|nr:hypothetical protein [Actinomycetota bacterium]
MRTIPAATALLNAALLTTAVLTTSTAVPATAGGPADGTTRVVLRMPDCEGCTVQVVSALATDDPDEPRLWASLEKQVRDGKVAFPVPSTRTAGMQVLLDAPWEGHLGYRTTVVLRYAGQQPGEEMTVREARDRNRASSCFEGTSRDRVVLPVRTRPLQVQGVHERVRGTLAFAARAVPWLSPMDRAVDGVLGSQDLRVCR